MSPWQLLAMLHWTFSSQAAIEWFTVHPFTIGALVLIGLLLAWSMMLPTNHSSSWFNFEGRDD
jgi:hypothetical protein